MRHLFAFGIALAVAGVAFPAQAQGSPEGAAPVTVPVADPWRPGPLTLRVGGAFATNRSGGSEASRADVSTGIGLDVGRHVTLFADVHFGTTWFSYDGSLEDGLRVNAALWSHFDMSIATGMVVHALRREHVELDLFGEFEGSVARSSPTLTRLGVTTAQGSYDVTPYARDNSELSFSWYRAAIGPTIRGKWAWFSPSFTLGFEYLHGTLDTGLNPDSRLVLTRLGFESGRIEREHVFSVFRVQLIPGAEFRLGPRDRLAFFGSFAPGSEGWGFGGSTMFVHGF